MNELILELKQISPKEFFGPQNKNIELVKQFFPELKIIARGYKITAFGDEIKLKEAAVIGVPDKYESTNVRLISA